MTGSYLLDTDVISELRKRQPDPRVLAWRAGVEDAEVFLSVLVVGEIRQGADGLRARDPHQAAALDRWLRGLVRTYSDRLLPVTAEIADEWGRMNVPDRKPAVDGLLAATALVHRLTLVTRNGLDVAGTGVRVLNPFTAVR